MKALAMIFGYLIVAVLGCGSAYLLVHQFVPQAVSQDEIDPGLAPPADFDDELEGEDPFGQPADSGEILPEEELPFDSESETSAEDSFDVGTIESLVDDGYFYDPRGKRDPFKPYIRGAVGQQVSPEGPVVDLTPLQRFDLSELNLVGVMWDIDDPKAMIISPDGKVHVVGNNDKVGRNNGYIAVIREGELVVVESFEEDGEVKYNTRIMMMKQ